MSIEGEETTFSGRLFHKRMVFGKNVSLRRDVRDRGTKNLLVWPLVRVLSGTNWLSGMSISLLQIRYIIVTFDVALRCSRVFHWSSSVMAVTLLRLEKLFMTYRGLRSVVRLPPWKWLCWCGDPIYNLRIPWPAEQVHCSRWSLFLWSMTYRGGFSSRNRASSSPFWWCC